MKAKGTSTRHDHTMTGLESRRIRSREDAQKNRPNAACKTSTGKGLRQLHNIDIKNDYLEKCAKIGFFPDRIGWDSFYASPWVIETLKKRVEEERVSAERQGVVDPELAGKTDDEIISNWTRDKRGSPHQELLNELSKEVWNTACLICKSNRGSANFAFPFPWFCGEYPLPSFNAHCERTAHGALVLVYTELLQFVYSFMKLFILNCRITHHSSYDSQEDEPSVISALISDDDAIKGYSGLIARFIKGERCGPAPHGSESAVVGSKILDLTMSTIRFVVAHECGHILAGHISGGKNTFDFTPLQVSFLDHLGDGDRNDALQRIHMNPELTLAFRNAGYWDDERLADQYGMDLCLRPCWPLDGSLENLQEMLTRLSGLFIFFDLDSLLDMSVRRLFGTCKQDMLTADHPPSHMRLETIKRWIGALSSNSEILIAGASGFSDWLGERRTQILDYLVDNRTFFAL